MENSRLRVFRSVAEHLSFRRAGEELGLSQPAVTLQIKALEEELSVRLLNRSGNRVSLTPAGLIVQKHAEAISAQIVKAQEELSALKGEHAGKLHLGASTSIAQYVLPQLLGEFKRKCQQVQVSVISGNTEQILHHLLAERVAIGLVEGPISRREVRTEPLLVDELVLAMSAKHEWANRTFVSIEQLKGQPLLIREHGSGTRRVLEASLAKVGLKKPDLNVVMELDSTEAILSSIESNLGIGFVTHWAVIPRLPLGRIKTAPVKGLRILRNFSFLYPAGPEPAGLPGAFRRFAIEFPFTLPS